MTADFSGKLCAITGAGSNIGRAQELYLARRGAAPALSDINKAGLAETRALIGETASNRIPHAQAGCGRRRRQCALRRSGERESRRADTFSMSPA
jgi:NAD(P)-dependent dehydrogenase (short-subunit alcohol dehydrogenase family)